MWDWNLLRTVYSGTKGLRAAGRRYLPQYEAEADKSYERRLQMTALINILYETVQNTVARPFSKPLILRDDCPKQARQWSLDIDMEGSSINVFSRRAFRDAVLDGQVHVLADMNAASDAAVLQKDPKLLSRPYLTLVPARNLLAAYAINNNGERIVYHARIREDMTILEGFRERVVHRVRVINIGHWELWERLPSGWAVVEGGPMKRPDGALWDRVPLETFYTGQKDGDFIATPPFLDLAHLNIVHWQSSSDQRNILSKSRFPMLWLSGVSNADEITDENGDLIVGPHTGLVLPQGGQVGYVEPAGNAINMGFKDLEELLEAMRIQGMDPLMPRVGGGHTATQSSINESKARAPLEQWAWDFAAFMERNFDNMMLWSGLDDQVTRTKIEINTDFGVKLDSVEEFNTILQMRQMGEISRKTLYYEMQRRRLLGTHFDPELEAQNLEEEAMERMEQAQMFMDMGVGPDGMPLPEPDPADDGNDPGNDDPPPQDKSKDKAKDDKSKGDPAPKAKDDKSKDKPKPKAKDDGREKRAA
jgi:hypothetical protein